MRATTPPIIRRKSVRILKRKARRYRYARTSSSPEKPTIMIEALLQSIDGRLQTIEVRLDKVSEDVSELKTIVGHLPTWKGVGTAAVGMMAALGALLTWLAGGGALLLARVFAA